MDKYLLEILKAINTIIIPGLGALTITDKDTGAIMFMDYLKHDDGALSKHIADKEGIEEIDAKNMISKYVREILTILDQGDSYDMFEFGSFYKDGDDINFKNWEGQKIQADKPKAEKKSKTKKETKKEETKPVEELDSKEEKKEEKEKVIPVISETKEAKQTDLNIAQKEELDVNKEKLERLKENAREPKKRKKRGIGFWMLTILIVIIVCGGATVGIFYDEVKQHIPFLADEPVAHSNDELEKMKDLLGENENEEEANIDEEELEEEILEESEIIEEEIEENTENVAIEEISEVQETSQSSGSFHLIVGAFSSPENAEKLGDKFRSEGYNVRVGPGKGMNLVSIKSFATRSEAETGKSELKDVAPSAWIYKWD